MEKLSTSSQSKEMTLSTETKLSNMTQMLGVKSKFSGELTKTAKTEDHTFMSGTQMVLKVASISMRQIGILLTSQ